MALDVRIYSMVIAWHALTQQHHATFQVMHTLQNRCSILFIFFVLKRTYKERRTHAETLTKPPHPRQSFDIKTMARFCYQKYTLSTPTPLYTLCVITRFTYETSAQNPSTGITSWLCGTAHAWLLAAADAPCP
jgi:hypothetical protein